MTVLTIPFLPLEGDHQPPTFGTGSFKSRPILPSQAWLQGDTAHYTWSDIWLTNHIVQAVIAAALVIGPAPCCRGSDKSASAGMLAIQACLL